MKPIAGSRVRCAIYTRKSSEEGLDQSFNSLQAQREACEAYIASQRHEGWNALSKEYDDGGFSGGNMNRPALKQLLEDIAAGLIDTIVVYKVDRLTRSLTDFAKMVEAFDTKGVSFVSVTQQFNTTTSMGRLTLNVLLSFAQFEREVTGERIRDKIAASKKKGMWMGGLVPLGYDLKGRKLVVNPKEAKIVQEIFAQYLRLGSVVELKRYLDQKRIRPRLAPRPAAARLVTSPMPGVACISSSGTRSTSARSLTAVNPMRVSSPPSSSRKSGISSRRCSKTITTENVPEVAEPPQVP
jgi:site-specific DNA recombinase